VHNSRFVPLIVLVLVPLCVVAVAPAQVHSQASGTEPDLLQQVRMRQDAADRRATLDAQSAVMQAMFIWPWAPRFANRKLQSARERIGADPAVSPQCQHRLSQEMGWFLRH
jgi:hypothetical protein